MEDTDRQRALELTAKIVGSYVRSSPVPARDLPRLIDDVHSALGILDAPPEPAPAAHSPFVAVDSSVTKNHLTCLACGAKLKTLKRHLKVAHGLQPDEYRTRYGLPSSYPLTAPGYAEFRSGVAKRIGLGGTTHKN
jgi:predicted transcriptional regulator